MELQLCNGDGDENGYGYGNCAALELQGLGWVVNVDKDKNKNEHEDEDVLGTCLMSIMMTMLVDGLQPEHFLISFPNESRINSCFPPPYPSTMHI